MNLNSVPQLLKVCLPPSSSVRRKWEDPFAGVHQSESNPINFIKTIPSDGCHTRKNVINKRKWMRVSIGQNIPSSSPPYPFKIQRISQSVHCYEENLVFTLFLHQGHSVCCFLGQFSSYRSSDGGWGRSPTKSGYWFFSSGREGGHGIQEYMQTKLIAFGGVWRSGNLNKKQRATQNLEWSGPLV